MHLSARPGHHRGCRRAKHGPAVAPHGAKWETPAVPESAPELLTENEVKQLADSLAANVVSSAELYLEQDQLRRHGREIWQYVLVALLVMLFLEVVLQQRFARVRT